MSMRQRKRRLLVRFKPQTRITTPYGPGMYFHPGVYIFRFNDPRSRRAK